LFYPQSQSLNIHAITAEGGYTSFFTNIYSNTIWQNKTKHLFEPTQTPGYTNKTIKLFSLICTLNFWGKKKCGILLPHF
jgi:hypothetical protein